MVVEMTKTREKYPDRYSCKQVTTVIMVIRVYVYLDMKRCIKRNEDMRFDAEISVATKSTRTVHHIGPPDEAQRRTYGSGE